MWDILLVLFRIILRASCKIQFYYQESQKNLPIRYHNEDDETGTEVIDDVQHEQSTLSFVNQSINQLTMI